MSTKQTSTVKLSRDQIRAKNSDPNQGVSLCIPRVFNNISYRQIFKVMCDARLGFVERVDVIRTKDVKRAYIHFKAGGWNMRDQLARETLTALQAGDTLEVTYEKDKPWFWKVVISDSERPAEAPKMKARPTMKRRGRKQTLDLNDPIEARVASGNIKEEVAEELANLKKESPPPEEEGEIDETA